ncbi:MAG TPA: hypothetical protein QF564_05575 [Pirellulaceae bacterium]|nr:hypothetical protein [Pirellulaceae bacterium]
MSRSNQCVVAIYKRLAAARDATRAIDRGGIPMKLVSLVSTSCRAEADADGQSYQSYDHLPTICPRTCDGSIQCDWSGACVPKILQFGDNMEKDAALGAGVGGLAGLVTGAGVLTVANGESAVFVAPIMAATGIVGALLGAMLGWGVHGEHLAWYEQKVRAGGALLLVHGDPLEVARANGILRDTHPAELHMHAETSADAYELDPVE